jgi:hypothetical protein
MSLGRVMQTVRRASGQSELNDDFWQELLVDDGDRAGQSDLEARTEVVDEIAHRWTGGCRATPNAMLEMHDGQSKGVPASRSIQNLVNPSQLGTPLAETERDTHGRQCSSPT